MLEIIKNWFFIVDFNIKRPIGLSTLYRRPHHRRPIILAFIVIPILVGIEKDIVIFVAVQGRRMPLLSRSEEARAFVRTLYRED
jgi:hypothetical protein